MALQNPAMIAAMQAYQPWQLGGGAGGGGGGLGQLGTPMAQYQPAATATAQFTTIVHTHYGLDPTTNEWRMQVVLFQGPTGQSFTLYDGPFPVTKDGLLQHFAALTRAALEGDEAA